MSEGTTRNAVHKVMRYKSNVKRKGKSMQNQKIKRKCLIRSKRLLTKLKNPLEQGEIF